MSDPLSWGCCLDCNEAEEGCLKCVKCTKAFHLSCLSISEAPKEANWNCPNCITQAPRTARNDCTPLRNVAISRGSKRPAINSPSPPAPTTEQDDLRSTIQELLRDEFKNMLKQFNDTINQQLLPVKEEMKEITQSMAFINKKFEEIKTEQNTATNKIKELQEENVELKQTVGNLNMRMENLEQQMRSSNLEIQCVPEKKMENLYNIVTQLGKAVNYELQNADILHCTRVAKINPSSSRPRSIIVQLASPRIRDELLASTIKFNKSNPKERLSSNHLGLVGPSSPVYVVEHLSPSNKALHAATRLKAKEAEYRFVWIRNGRIFARKDENSEYIMIKNMDTLKKLI